MTTQNLKRKKKNNNLSDRKRIRLLKDSANTRPLSDQHAGKQVEEEIKTLKQQMEFILGVTKTGLDIIDSEFIIRYIDPEWAKVYGDPTGKKCYQYFMDRSEVCPNCGIPIALKTKAIAVTEEILLKEGNRPIQVTTIPFQNSRGEWLVAEVNVDISDRKRAEEALFKAHEDLEIRVQERTTELARANEAMQVEITERKRAEEALRRSEETAKRMAKENSVMADIGRIISSTLNIEEVYERFAEEVHKLIPFEGIAINIINHKEGTVNVPYVLGFAVPGCQPGDVFPLKGSVTGEVARARSGLIIQTGDKSELQARFPTLLTAFEAGLRSVIAVPLISKDEVIGAIHFRSTKPKTYSVQDLKLAESIGSQIAGAVATAQLFTEHKQAEKMLRESEEKHRTIIENIEDGYFEVDVAGNLTFFNDALCRMLGYSREELMGMNNRQYTDQENAKKLYQAFNKVYRTGNPTKTFDWEVMRKDGIKRIGEVSVSLMRDLEGKPCGFRGIARDITERKRAEEALRIEKQRFQTLSENAPFGMVMIDQEGTFKYINPKFKELFGYDLTDIPDGKTWFRRAYPDSTYRHQAISDWIRDLESAKQGEKRPRIFTVHCKDGSEKIVIFISVQLETGENLMACEDITERKHAEEALRESERKYRELTDFLPELVYESDENGNILFANHCAFETFGYTQEDFDKGLNIFQMIIPEDREKVKKNLQMLLNGKKLVGNEYTALKKNGMTFPVIASTNLIKRENKLVGLRGIVIDITERKQAEADLLASEVKYRLLVENAGEAIFVAQDGFLKFANRKTAEMTGYPKEELISKPLPEFIHPDDQELVLDRHLKRLQGKELPAVYPFRIINKSGNIRWVELNSVLIIWERRPATLNFLSDITERRQAEEALRESEERYRTILENIEDGYFEVDIAGNFTFFNNSLCKVLGYPKEEMMGMNNRQYMDKETVQRVYQAYHRVYTTGEPLKTFDYKIIRRNGTTRFVESGISIIRNGKGERIGFRGVARDVTERRQAEEALRESETKYRQLVEHAPIGIYELDLDKLKFLSVNDVMCEVMGYTKEEFLSMSPFALLVEESRNTLAERMRKIISGGKVPDSAEFKLRTKDGREFWALINTKVFYRDGKPLKAQVVAQDISERKKLEEQLIQSQKIEAVGRLAGGIAHDFNNLLTVIKGYSQLSLLDLKESDLLWGNIQEIQKATERATDLTRQLLAFSRRQILDLKVLDLNTLLRDLDKMLRRIIGEDIELITLLDKDLWRVKIDPGQFEQMILNLAVNARDAMPSGGKLTIETTNVELDEEYARSHMGVIPGRYARLSVSDTGSGISQEIKGKVFEPFFTTKEKGKGTGLGLSTVYGIVKQSGGNIWVYSEPGQGTTFKIYLPRVEEDLDTLHGRDETDYLPKGSETVLLVEDEPSVRDLALRLLNQQGYKVLEAANGEEALRAVQEHMGEKIHLLLTDVVMPQMGGKELAERLKILRPDIKVLYTSGYTDDAIVHHGVLNSGTHFLQKPFSHKTLSHKVREVLDR